MKSCTKFEICKWHFYVHAWQVNFEFLIIFLLRVYFFIVFIFFSWISLKVRRNIRKKLCQSFFVLRRNLLSTHCYFINVLDLSEWAIFMGGPNFILLHLQSWYSMHFDDFIISMRQTKFYKDLLISYVHACCSFYFKCAENWTSAQKIIVTILGLTYRVDRLNLLI